MNEIKCDRCTKKIELNDRLRTDYRKCFKTLHMFCNDCFGNLGEKCDICSGDNMTNIMQLRKTNYAYLDDLDETYELDELLDDVSNPCQELNVDSLMSGSSGVFCPVDSLLSGSLGLSIGESADIPEYNPISLWRN
jgi:hypothetical protein